MRWSRRTTGSTRRRTSRTGRSEEHTSELQSQSNHVSRLLFIIIRPPPRSTLFPSTTLFRSKAALSADEYAVVAPHYGLDAPPNFENQYWHLRVMKPFAYLAQRLELAPQHVQSLLESARAKMLAVREQRTRPGRDEKILVSWNALMVKGMTRAARVFDQPEWLASARAATEFIRATLWRADDERTGARKRLLATCRDGKIGRASWRGRGEISGGAVS